MNKTAIKNFAIWARKKLISDITYQAGMLGVTEKGIAKPLPQSTLDLQFYDIGTKNYAEVSGVQIRQREKLVAAIHAKECGSDYKTAFRYVMEEVAYTWFNRLIAVRFMEVNDYLPSRVRVLSSESAGKAEPDIVTNPFDTDFTFSDKETTEIYALKENGDEKSSNALFRMLFIKQCNKLHEILPRLFEETADYSELLLTISFTDKDGVLWHLVNDIPESDFDVSKEGQVEIIGWMYQYYNTEPKDEVFAELKKNIKISKEKIPAATQLFTPDWIVRYMVENSLGRLWVEGHPNDELKAGWKYYLEEAEQEPQVQEQLAAIRAEYKKLNPEDIKLIDPCMGSGHILVYAFDVLMQIYEACGYTQRDAAQSIVANNIYGLDIDDRAAQLAYFAVMMKARQYDRRFFTRGITPHVIAVENSPVEEITFYKELKHKETAISLVRGFYEAKEYGSILEPDVTLEELQALERELTELKGKIGVVDLFDEYQIRRVITNLMPIIEQARMLVLKYHIIVSNPPYMNQKGMTSKLSAYLKECFSEGSSDLYSAVMIKSLEQLHDSGFLSMITMESWMFLSSYEEFRMKQVYNKNLLCLLHMPYLGKGGTSLGISFGTCAFVLRKMQLERYCFDCQYIRYYECDENGVPLNYPCENERKKTTTFAAMRKIPGVPLAYWISDKLLLTFDGEYIESYAKPCKGIDTGNNDRFIRLWYEVPSTKFNVFSNKAKWVVFNKGGSYRKWYGNYDYVVNWEKDGFELIHYPKSNIRNPSYFFKSGLTWTLLNSGGNFGMRYLEGNGVFDANGLGMFPLNARYMNYIMGLYNSIVTKNYLSILSSTMAFVIGDMKRIPIVIDEKQLEEISGIVEANITLAKNDWNMYETSWDFAKHPLIEEAPTSKTIEEGYKKLKERVNSEFYSLKCNEEELNRRFIGIYGLADEMNSEVDDALVTITSIYDSKNYVPDDMLNGTYVLVMDDIIRSLVSYAVGCMFGRYSLDVPGLAYAGGDWDGSKYKTFLPDMDNCIPITDETYFEDDVVGRFVEFIRTVYGSATLEENLSFIAKALGNKGATSREVIRNYFLNDFMKDHLKIYQKRPIYWLFDSGKQNGFKALVYMHRWNADTVGNLRVEYLHRMQRVYEKEIERMQDTIENSRVSREVSAAQKRKEKLTKQLKETKDYDAKIAHIALSRIDIDLDDGVKVNYEKVQKGADGKSLEILAKIK